MHRVFHSLNLAPLGDKELCEITLGVFILKLATDYAAEDVGENGVYELILSFENIAIVRYTCCQNSE